MAGGPAPVNIGELETPFLTIDLDRAARNIERAQSYCTEHGYRFRPHIKTHKLPQVARMQINAGAVGITCQKLGEAEVMADAGIEDILIAYPILGQSKLSRLGELAGRSGVTVAADSVQAVQAAGRAGEMAGRDIGFLVECDTGMGRLGVQSPQDAAALAQVVSSTPGVRFDGLMTYPTSSSTAAFMAEATSLLDRDGLRPTVVSGGGTPTLYSTHTLAGSVLTEVRAGEYVFGDRSHLSTGVMRADEIAAAVISEVVGRPTPNRAILDAGSKALSMDPASNDLAGFGLIVEYPGASVYALSEEHGHVDLSQCEARPDIGERVTIVPNHVCACVNLHSEVATHNGGVGVEILPVAARGRIR
jgi:D-serine deaminase-like pyridoxal phosphate-dependent protein